MGQAFSVEFSSADRLQGQLLKCRSLGKYISLLITQCCVYDMCVFVCLFVCYKKGSVIFYPNNATFKQNIDDCIELVIKFIFDRKQCISECARLQGPAQEAGLLCLIITIVIKILIIIKVIIIIMFVELNSKAVST